MDGNGTLLKTTYYVGAYEKEVTPGDPYQKEIHYIYGGDGLDAIFTKQYSSQTMYYVHKDHLGSLDKLTSSAGVVVQKTSFDACIVKHGFCEARTKTDVERIPAETRSREGRRNPDNWTYNNIPATIFSRGYTGHEHLDQFNLINMNGRMYDPLLGRFLSVDPFVTDPFNTQEYNRYSYVMNNPLKYVDPSGFTYKQFMDKHYGEGNYYYRGDSPGSWGGGGGSSGGSRYTYDPKSPTGYRDDHGNYVTWEIVQANLPTNLQQISPSNFNLILNGGFAYQGRASVVYGNAYAPDPNGIYDIYMYFEIEPYCVAQGQGGDQSWILGPRGADWGSSLENLGAWAREIDNGDGGLIYGHTFSNNDPSNRAAGKLLKVIAISLPPTSVMMSSHSIFIGTDPITGRDLSDDPTKQFTEPALDIFLNIAPFVPHSIDIGWIIFQNTGGFPQNSSPLHK